jgi:hypothetical protein
MWCPLSKKKEKVAIQLIYDQNFGGRVRCVSTFLGDEFLHSWGQKKKEKRLESNIFSLTSF